jgi:hypothetical protein
VPSGALAITLRGLWPRECVSQVKVFKLNIFMFIL